jgi:hypothetical protein
MQNIVFDCFLCEITVYSVFGVFDIFCSRIFRIFSIFLPSLSTGILKGFVLSFFAKGNLKKVD